jgi:very-short-patch-repair endonuclease
VIKEITGLAKQSRIYKNLFNKFCKHEQKKFMPSDWYPEHYQKLIELADQKIWFKQIAKMLGFGQKQVYYVMKKLGLHVNTRNPNAWSCVTSKVEFQVLSWIKEENYQIETQFHLGNFLFDGHIKNSNILIEVNGDYWHCNPKVYKSGPINQMQKSHIKRDFAKKAFAAKQGYYLVTLWEKDIKENLQKTKEWLLNKIKSNLVEIKND